MAEREKAEMLALRERVNAALQRSPQSDPDYPVRMVESVYAEAIRRESAELSSSTMAMGALCSVSGMDVAEV